MSEPKANQPTSLIRRRSQAEQDAYMAGQRAALDLAGRKGLDYAEHIIGISHATIRDHQAQEHTRHIELTDQEAQALLAWLPKYDNPANTWERNIASIRHKLDQ